MLVESARKAITLGMTRNKLQPIVPQNVDTIHVWKSPVSVSSCSKSMDKRIIAMSQNMELVGLVDYKAPPIQAGFIVIIS